MTVLQQYTIQGQSSNALVESVEAGVRAGALPPGAALPTVRALAAACQVSPASLLQAAPPPPASYARPGTVGCQARV